MLGRDAIMERIGKGQLVIDTTAQLAVGPASYDLTLANHILVVKRRGAGPIQVGEPFDSDGYMRSETLTTSNGQGSFAIYPDTLVLLSSEERFEFPPDMSGLVVGKSSIGRLGLAAPYSSGFVDPGFRGRLTVWAKNLSPWTLLLRPGIKFAQLIFFDLGAPTSLPYDGKYQDQEAATESRTSKPPALAVKSVQTGRVSSRVVREHRQGE